jgi:shikimate dehydrogenase
MTEQSTILRAGLIGHPVAHSRSPALQHAAFDALGVSARYELWDTPPEALAARIASLRASDILGANVTIPHKTAVYSLLDAIPSEAARLTGAVNAIARVERADGVKLLGYNMDVSALRRVFAEQGPALAGRRLLTLGAGGAARSAVAAALLEGAAPWVAARRVDAAEALLAELRVRHGGNHPARALDLADERTLTEALRQTAILVNATPIGTLDPAASPIPLALLDALPDDADVFDMVYNPPATALVRAARERGLRASGGLPMLLYQGAEAFTLWTGRIAPLAAMRAALGMV